MSLQKDSNQQLGTLMQFFTKLLAVHGQSPVFKSELELTS